jgi:hypothetical protein
MPLVIYMNNNCITVFSGDPLAIRANLLISLVRSPDTPGPDRYNHVDID